MASQVETLFLSHYYSWQTRPLCNIMAYDERTRLRAMEYLSTKEGKGFNRYRRSRNYMRMRERTELWLYDEFIKKGGKPAINAPVYFVLGESRYMCDWFGPQTKELTLDLADVPETAISFTNGDSLFACILNRKNLLTVPDLPQLLQDRTLAQFNRYCDEENKYIEAQIWDADIVKTLMGEIPDDLDWSKAF